MKKRNILWLVACLCCLWGWAQNAPSTQGIIFAEGSWKEVLQMARESGKPVFLDVYTSWCGPCKMMASQTFTQKEVGDYYNAHFICYKIDAEKGEGVDLAKRLGVDSYPSCFFLTPDEKVVSSFLGAKDVKALLREGAKAVKNAALLPQLTELEQTYADGKRTKEFLMHYCEVREEFGEKGGQPVADLVNLLTDSELLKAENARWIQAMTLYDAPLMKRVSDVLTNAYPVMGKKELQKLNTGVMKWLSACLTRAMDANHKDEFDFLMTVKRQMNRVEPTNNDNAVFASIGGGMAYLDTEQILLNFYGRNKYEQEFEATFLDYIGKQMEALPTDSLIRTSNEEERIYQNALKSDTISEADKQMLQKGRGLMQMMTGAKRQVLATVLYSAAERYWKMKQPASESLRRQYITWLHFFYALQRNTNVGIPVVQKLRELGAEKEAHALLDDLIGFLTLQEAPAEELSKARNAWRD